MAIVETIRFDKTEKVTFDRMDIWGYARARVSLAKPGIMIYETKDGRKIRELVPRSVLQDKAVLHSIAGIPITVDHPKERIVTPKTSAKYMVGSAMYGEYDDERDHQVADICLTDERAMEAIEQGKNMFSPCYPVKIDDTGGVDPEFGEYDTMQVERGPYNHNALTDNPRGGVDMTIHNDDAAFQVGMFIRADEGDDGNKNNNGNGQNGYQEMMTKMDSMISRFDSQNTRFDSIEKRIDALENKGNNDGGDNNGQVNNDSYVELFNERNELLAAYAKVKVTPDQKLDNKQLKRTLVASQFKSLKQDSADEVVDAMWQELKASLTQGAQATQPKPPEQTVNGAFGVSLLNADSKVAENQRSKRISASEIKTSK